MLTHADIYKKIAQVGRERLQAYVCLYIVLIAGLLHGQILPGTNSLVTFYEDDILPSFYNILIIFLQTFTNSQNLSVLCVMFMQFPPWLPIPSLSGSQTVTQSCYQAVISCLAHNAGMRKSCKVLACIVMFLPYAVMQWTVTFDLFLFVLSSLSNASLKAHVSSCQCLVSFDR
jgi:hypothetical protein